MERLDADATIAVLARLPTLELAAARCVCRQLHMADARALQRIREDVGSRERVLVVAGGLDAAGALTSTAAALIGGMWRALPSLPAPRAHAALKVSGFLKSSDVRLASYMPR